MGSQVRQAFLWQMLLIAAIALVPLLLLHGATIQQDQALAEREAEQVLKAHASAIATQAGDMMQRARRMVSYIGGRSEVVARDWERCSDAITGLNNVDPAFVTILVLDAVGQPLCSSRPTAPGLPATYADRAWFQQALRSDGIEVGKPRIGSLFGHPILPVTGTVRGKDGTVRAVVVLSLDLLQMSRRWGEERPVAGQQLTVLDAGGTVLARFPEPEAWIGRPLDAASAASAAAGATGADRGRASEQAAVAGEDWSVWISQPSAPMFSLAHSERLQALGLTIAVALAALALALLQANKLSSALADLSRTAVAATGGASSARANEAVSPMFREVARAMNVMLDTRDLAQRRVERLASINAALSQTNRAIVRFCGSAQLFNELCRICVEAGHATGAAIVLRDQGGVRPVAALGLDWAAVLRSMSEPGSEAALLERTLGDGLPHYGNLQAAASASAQQAGSLAVLPFRQDGIVIGALLVAMAEADFFDAELMQALEEMTADLSFALDLGIREAARLAAEAEVSASRDRLRTTFNAMPVAILVRHADSGEVLEVNEAICQRYGMRREDIIGRHYSALPVQLDEDPHWAELFERVRAGERVRNLEIKVTSGARPAVHLLLNGEMIEFDGRSCMLTASVDITDRKLAERALARREQQLSSVVEHATDAIITIDAALRITVFNLAASRMFGISAAQASGMDAAEFFASRICGTQHEAFTTFLLTDAVEADAVYLPQVCGVAGDGSEFPIEATLTRVDDGSDEGPLRIAVLSDVTAALQAEQARQARVAAEVANDAKTQFLTRMSHELRTPLNAVLGFAQLLEAQFAGTQQAALGYSRHILNAGRHLLELINDMLDISRIEAGQLRLELMPVDAFALIEESASLVRAMAKTHQIELRLPAPAGQPAGVIADPQRLRQVIVNLLSNAIKYNRAQGQVEIRAQQRDGRLCIEIEDNGFGMSPEQLAHLFEPFNRLGRDRTRIEGTGIGMTLTRQLVALMDGSLEVDSEPERGTRVTVNLAATTEPPTRGGVLHRPAPGDNPAAAPQGRVLYIEDNLVNILLLQEFFRRWPEVRLDVAENGEDGIRLAAELDPDLILLDMQLPDMEGIDVLAALNRRDTALARRTVSLSASAMQTEVDRALAAGASDYWTKPLDFTRFEAAVVDWLARERRS